MKTTALTAAGIGLGRFAVATDISFDPKPAHGWRVFEVTTRVEPVVNGATQVWLPLPSVEDATWIRPMGNLWQGNAASVQELHDPVYGARMLAARWDASEPAPMLEVVSRFAIRDRAIDLSHPGKVAPLDQATRKLYTQATKLLPTDGLVRKTAVEITKGAKTDLDKAKAIYEWIVDNTQRNPKTQGCGLGDIRFMLETGDLTCKCAD
ncbi:MAG: transglutaminase, partial [Thiobacillus sp.]